MYPIYTFTLWLISMVMPPPPTQAPRLLWSDEFNYTGQPDASKWTYDLGNGCPNLCGWGNKELQHYTKHANNVSVDGSKLIITARRQKINNRYTSARIKSTGSWKYGYIEIKAKLPQGRGTWPGIWMLPDSAIYGGWPRSGEIDIMEHVGYDPGEVHGTVHTQAFHHSIGTQVGKQHTVPTFHENFHRYAVNWTEDKIEFYIDNELFHTFANNGNGIDAWPFDHPFHLLMNIAVGGGWGGKEGVDKTIWPQKMEIDWVRVYEPLYTDAQKQAIKLANAN
jgi:beta-glucanase (GH16 family)